jgi:hypothetical protein
MLADDQPLVVNLFGLGRELTTVGNMRRSYQHALDARAEHYDDPEFVAGCDMVLDHLGDILHTAETLAGEADV